jgi:isochorismate synthase EntC
LKYVTDQSAHSRGWYRTPVGAKDPAGTHASAIRSHNSNPWSRCYVS